MLNCFGRVAVAARQHLVNRVLSNAYSSSPTSLRGGVYELRTYTIKPEYSKAYLQHSNEYASLRKQLNPHFLSYFSTELGGTLNQVKHFYHYSDLDQRERVRGEMQKSRSWSKDFIDAGRHMVEHQESMLYVEAAQCHAAAGVESAVDFISPPPVTSCEASQPVYELRTYQLRPGYDAVPTLQDKISAGLPGKVAADNESRLVLYAFSDVGILNNVIELWRYPSYAASLRARVAARPVKAWREAIAEYP
ncbi:hypothetical protein CYMTET_8644 [Cymbomonas tetramitiformis]|uniref:NIPSNAP domain-containing protein n=1 Tax=Cymbomonas tetramitiformis TaxID=36881 RepID=A0AAE0GSQ0_9CHLO|nr:hypothetical protein CYMTET_8644 [Cymbomonas tetramitiformis]